MFSSDREPNHLFRNIDFPILILPSPHASSQLSSYSDTASRVTPDCVAFAIAAKASLISIPSTTPSMELGAAFSQFIFNVIQ